MKKYYIYKAEGPDVQSGLELRYTVDWDDNITQEKIDQHLDNIGYNRCVDNFEMYQYIDEYEEENGLEWEPNFYFREVTKEEFEDCGLFDF